MSEKLEKKKTFDVQPSMEENFYIEELDERLEMSMANPGPILPNEFCITWAIQF